MYVLLTLQSDSHNFGKTSSLTILRSKLLGDVTYKQVIGRYHTCPHDHRDFVDAFEKNGKLIGISTTGDVDSLITSFINELNNGNRICDIIITASGTTSYAWGRRTMVAIKSFSNYTHLFMLKEPAPIPVSQNDSLTSPYNIQTAQDVFDVLERLIK